MYETEYAIIREAYNLNNYSEQYRRGKKLTTLEKVFLDKFQQEFPTTENRVLDVGCGNAVLFDRYLSENCSITGIDVSSVQIRRARRNLPKEKFICDDFLTGDFSYWRENFDGILCMYTLFHFLESDLYKALRRMYEYLKPGGIVLINIRKEQTVSVKFTLNWCGQPMYWYLPGVSETLIQCTKAGFTCQVFENPDNRDYVFALLNKV